MKDENRPQVPRKTEVRRFFAGCAVVAGCVFAMVVGAPVAVRLFSARQAAVLAHREELPDDSDDGEAPADLSVDGIKRFADFRAMIKRKGWRGMIGGTRRFRKEGALTLTRSWLRYEFPEGDGYYPAVGIDILVFAEAGLVPGSDGNAAQVYRTTDEFPLGAWPGLHPEATHAQSPSFRWHTLRIGSAAIVVYAFPERQDIATFFSELVEFTTQTDGEAEWEAFRHRLNADYRMRRNRFLAVRSIQDTLRRRGLFEDSIDGMPGVGTGIALQRFLSGKGFYAGLIDGDLDDKLMRSGWSDYQRALGVAVTGELDLVSARAMAVENRRRRR